MAYRVILTDKAEADVDSVLKWFRDQQATDAGALVRAIDGEAGYS